MSVDVAALSATVSAVVTEAPKTTGSRGDVFVVRTSKPVETSEKMGYFDRVTVSVHILKTANQETEGSQLRSPFGRRAVRQRGYGLRLLIFKSRSGSDKKRRFTVDL